MAREMLTCTKTGYYAVVDLAEAPRDESSALQIALDLAELCDRLAWDDQVRAVVLCFEGRMNQCAQSSMAESVAGLKQPVIAAIRGDAVGAGLELALACDIRIAAENARFGLPQIQEGILPSGGGTQRLPRLIGQGRALQMILSGEPVNAREAFQWGLVNRIVPAGKELDSAVEIAGEMSEKSPLSLSYAKEALYKGMDLTLEQGIRMELDLYLHLFTTADRTEGVTAYKEKRKPKFEGI